jgi:putative FmdB family regulatory protein
MPIYEFECEEHGKFEALFPRVVGVDYQPCPTCDVPAPRVFSLTVMRPDKYWDGYVHPNYGYITSQTQLNKEMKRRNHVPISGRDDREAWDKIADDAQKDKAKKLQKDVRGWSKKTFGPSGLGLGGADGEKFIKEHS